MSDKRRADRYAHHAAWAAAVAAALGLAGTAQAADAPSVTLADALRQALRPENPVLQQQSDSVAGAAGRLQEAQGAFDWRADVKGGWQQLYVAHVSPNGFLTNQTDIVNGYYYSVDMAKQFRNGVEVAPGVTAYPGTGATPAQTSGLTQIRPQFGLKIPVLRGSGASFDAPERAAQAGLQAARASRAFGQQQMAQQVAATFWRCLADARLRADAEELRAHSDGFRSTLQKEQEKGLIEPMAVQQFTLSHLGDKLSADRAQDEETRCRRDLGYLMTGSLDQGTRTPVGELPDIAQLAPAVDKLRDQDLIQLALDQRQDLQAAARQLSAAHENVVSAKDTLRPTLDLHIDPIAASVVFSRPFGNNYGKGKNAEARAQENAAIVALRQLQDQVRTQVSDSLAALRRARADWATLSGAEAQMAVIVSDTEKRARLGGSTSWLDYMNAQNQLTQLHQQQTNVQLAFAVNLSLLQLAIGAIDPDRPTELAQNFARTPIP